VAKPLPTHSYHSGGEVRVASVGLIAHTSGTPNTPTIHQRTSIVNNNNTTPSMMFEPCAQTSDGAAAGMVCFKRICLGTK
jgi:hypothetical protein